MNVFVLGAGASKGYSLSPTQMRMPIAKDFFRTFQCLAISENPWVLIGDILNVSKRDWGMELGELFDTDTDIEEFHSYVEEKLLQSLFIESKEGFEYWKAYHQLIFLFASVVNEIQNGPTSNAHVKLVRLMKPNDIIMTFNWDTLMDRALFETTAWKPDYGYGIVPKKIFRNQWEEPQKTENDNFPVLLKLHGSSNWITSHTIFDKERKQITLTQESSPETLHVYEFAERPYPTYQGRYMGSYQPFSYGYYPPNLDDPGKTVGDDSIIFSETPQIPWYPSKTSFDNGLTSMPLIIPPVKKKTFELFGQLFNILWKQAENSLVHAENIVIIGYSFPKTDYKSNDLFLNAFLKRSTEPQVIVIDPTPERVIEKFKFEFGISRMHPIEDHFSEDFDMKNFGQR